MMEHSPVLAFVALLAFACTAPRSDTGAPAPASPNSSQDQPSVTASPDPAAPATDWICSGTFCTTSTQRTAP